MMKRVGLSELLSDMDADTARRLELFALINLGVVELLASGSLSSAEATQFFFNAENCMFVRKRLREKIADQIMSHGVQLRDLFDVLPGREAQQEFQRELGAIRSLCLQLLRQHELVA
jgi:hypothetical protein